MLSHDEQNDHGVYAGHIRDMIKNGKTRLVVNINDLLKKNSKRATGLLSNHSVEMAAFNEALRQMVTSINPEYLRRKDPLQIGLEGSFKSNHVTPKILSSRFLGQVVCVEGIVANGSMIRPKVVKTVHFKKPEPKVKMVPNITCYEPSAATAASSSSSAASTSTGLVFRTPTKSDAGNRNLIKDESGTPGKSGAKRSETSLGQLTKKFIDLLKEAPGGVCIYYESVV